MNLKLIIGLLVGLIVVQIIGAIVFFNLPARKDLPAKIADSVDQSTNTTSAVNARGKISLNTDQMNIKVGETATVSVVIDTNNKPIDGVDLSLVFDPKLLEVMVVNGQNSGANLQKLPFVPGRLFSDVPFNTFNVKNGTASMSAISTQNTKFTGSGTLAVITFKALAPGSASVKVVASPGNTTDSNMVAEGKEILSETQDANITITKK